MLHMTKELQYCDMHIHTYFSDGKASPKEAVVWAKNCGMQCISITDHENTNGIAEAARAAQRLGLEFHKGIELAARHKEIEVHILGYDIDSKNKKLKEVCEKSLFAREERNKKFFGVLEKEYGINENDIRTGASSNYIGKTHMAQALVKAGAAKNKTEVFEKIFTKSAFAVIEKDLVSAKEIIEAVKSAGGTAVLAHPGKLRHMGKRGSEEFFRSFEIFF